MIVSVRPLKKEDALTSYKWRNNPVVWKYTGSRPDRYITPEIEMEWITRVLKNTDEKRYAIIAENEYVGNVQLLNITKQSAEFHIFIGDTNFWNKGVATKATMLVIKEAKKLNLDYITLKVNKSNTAAIKLYNKAGFEFNSQDNDSYTMLLNLK